MAKIPAQKMEGGSIGTPEVIGTFNDGVSTYTRYRKIIDGGTLNLTQSGTNYVYTKSLNTPNIHGILSANVILSLSGTTFQPLPYTNRLISYYLSNTDITIISNDSTTPSAFNGRKVIISLEYY